VTDEIVESKLILHETPFCRKYLKYERGRYFCKQLTTVCLIQNTFTPQSADQVKISNKKMPLFI